MQTKPKIGLDVDEVLADFVKAHRATCVEAFSKPEDPNLEPIDWPFSNYGLTEIQLGAVWELIRGTKDFWLDHIEPLDAERDSLLLERAQQKYELYFITARAATEGMSVQQQTSLWLKEHLGVFEPIVLAVESGVEKVALIEALNLRAFIDDRLETVESIAKETSAKAFVMDRLYNRTAVEWYTDAKRVHSLAEYFDALEAL